MAGEPASAEPDSVRVLEDPRRVRQALSPLRIELLRHLKTPGSASGLADRLGVTRQKLNYHLRKLEELDLVRLVEVRKRRGFEERLYRVAARALVVAPEVLGEITADTDELQDRFSSAYLVAAAGRMVGDVAAQRSEASAAGKRLATVTQETEIRFRSPSELGAFTEDLAERLAELARRYDRPDADGSRPYHVLVGVHPTRAGAGVATAASHPPSETEKDHD